MELTLDFLKQSLDSYKAIKADESGGNDAKNVVFMPEGKHRGRFIIDASGKHFYSKFDAYGYFRAGVRDPSQRESDVEGVPEALKTHRHPLQELYYNYLRHAQKWSMGKQTVFLFYFYLVETDSPSDNWKAGNLYAVIGKRIHEEAVMSFIENMTTNAPDQIVSMLDPSAETPLLDLQYKGGKDGKCTVAPFFPLKNTDPVDTSAFDYGVLDDVYIPKMFSQERYDKLVEKAVKLIKENKDFIREAKYKSDCEYAEKVAKRENKPVEYPEKPTHLVVKVGDKVLYDESKDGVSELKDAAASTPASTPTPVPAATPAAEPKAETPPTPAPAAEPKAETPAPAADMSVDADPFAQFAVQ